MSYDLKSLIEHIEANPELIVQSAKKVRLEMNAAHALGARPTERGINTLQAEPDFAAAADLLLEWGEAFPEREPDHPTRFVNRIREHWENMFMEKWHKITNVVEERGASKDEVLVLAIWCEKLMEACLERGLHASHTPSVKYTFPCAVRVFEQLNDELSLAELGTAKLASSVVGAVMRLTDKTWDISGGQEPEAVKTWAEEIAGTLLGGRVS